jgi:flagellin
MNLNASASALYLLNNSYSQLNSIASQLASGKSVSSAADNPVAWSQAQSATTSANEWTAYANAASNTNGPELKTASAALTTIASLLGAMQTSATDAQSNSGNSTTDLASMQQDSKSIQAIISTATSNGLDLLDGSNASLTFALGVGSDTISLTTVDLADSNTSGGLQTAQAASSSSATNLLSLGTGDVSSTNIAATIANIQAGITQVNGYATTIGSTQNAITAMSSFAQSMATNYSDLADSITAADTTTLSAKESALQTQIALSTQALSIANSTGQDVVKLLG